MTLEHSEIRHGTRIGRFVVVAELGSGGMGVVYAAHDRELDRQVALKVMRGAAEDDEDRVRMLREGQAMARITHPNVITVFEVGAEAGLVFLAQELLDGGTLGQWLAEPRTQAEILDKFITAGRGLAAAHAAGLVHRDFKPDNVLLGKDGRVRVSDFGLARAVGAFGDPGQLMVTAPGGGPPLADTAVTRASPMTYHLTRTGAVMGTPMFMAPEQHEGRRADERSDQFAFCVALHHALYGDWPFEGKTSVALADNVINGVMKPPPRSAKVPARIRKILLRGLSTHAAERYPSMDALLAELAAPPARSGKRAAFALAGLVVVGGAGAAGYLALAQRDAGPAPPPAPVVQDRGVPATVKDPTVDTRLLADAIDRNTLDTTRQKFDGDAQLIRDRAKAAMARSASALMTVLAGDLAGAEAKLKAAEASAGDDPRARAFADMAASAIAHARGELRTAAERSERCVKLLGDAEPIARTLCLQTRGEVAADEGDAAAARDYFTRAQAIAEGLANSQARDERVSSLALALAQLDFDVQSEDVALEPVAALQKAARRRGAVSCEANAAVLASRIRLAKADQQGALDVFDGIDPAALQVYRTQLMARIARGEVLGYREEGADNEATGIDHLNDAIDEAKAKGFWGLVLEARLARLRVMLTTGREGAEDERAALVKEATTRGYRRIAELARAFLATAEAPP